MILTFLVAIVSGLAAQVDSCHCIHKYKPQETSRIVNGIWQPQPDFEYGGRFKSAQKEKMSYYIGLLPKNNYYFRKVSSGPHQ